MLTLETLTLENAVYEMVYYLGWLSCEERMASFFQLFRFLMAFKPRNQKNVAQTPATRFLKNLRKCTVFICMWTVPSHQRTLDVIIIIKT